MMLDPSESWVIGQLALHLLAVDPGGLGGLHLRARAGPVRDAFLAGLPDGLRPIRRIAPSISDTQLFGGIDIAGTLAQGRVARSTGLLATPSHILLTMAERCPPGLAARIAQTMDAGRDATLILLDEGADDDETAPIVLTDRLAFCVDLDGLRPVDLAELAMDADDIAAARARLPGVTCPDDVFVLMVVTAQRFGIVSLRAPLLALRTAIAHAALVGNNSVTPEDVQIAAQLVLAHRATQIPQDDDETPDDEPPPEDDDDGEGSDKPDDDSFDLPQDMLIDAMKALLPPEVLAALNNKSSGKGAKGSGGAGLKRKGNRRGRPLPSRPGRIDSGARIDIVATLRAAAPWQMVRRRIQPDHPGLLIRPGDIHVRQYQELSDRLIIFAVDASGSSAVARLSEAKGAIELMLAEAYARRDHVALIAFRGDGADLILAPTRSLVQTKRQLAGLPGGGGTPLAAGLQATADLARRALGQGLSPSVALLTDGRANVALPGRTGRVAAAEDAQNMARVLRQLNLPTAVIDTGQRPTADLRALAGVLGATYVPLPRADAQGLKRAISTALEE